MKRRLSVFAVLCMAVVLSTVMLSGCATEEYVPASKDPVVSSPTIGEDGVLRVGVDAENSPLAGMSDDEIIGIDVDVAAAIADELGLKLSIVDVGSDPDGAVAEGKVDIVMGIDSDDSADGLWLSDVYLPTGVALFSLTSAGTAVPSADADVSIAAAISSESAWTVSKTFGEDSLVAESTLSDAFDALAAGTVDFVAADAVIGLYAARVQDIDVTLSAMASGVEGYSIGISSDNADLQTAVSDAMATLVDGGVIDVIECKWLSQDLDLASLEAVS